MVDVYNVITSGSGLNRDKLTRDDDFVALITPGFCKNDNCLGEMRDAKAMNLPMYAIVQAGFKVPDIVRDMPWKSMIIFQDDSQLPAVSDILKHIIMKSHQK